MNLVKQSKRMFEALMCGGLYLPNFFVNFIFAYLKTSFSTKKISNNILIFKTILDVKEIASKEGYN